jgi:hypothetical protein
MICACHAVFENSKVLIFFCCVDLENLVKIC